MVEHGVLGKRATGTSLRMYTSEHRQLSGLNTDELEDLDKLSDLVDEERIRVRCVPIQKGSDVTAPRPGLLTMVD